MFTFAPDPHETNAKAQAQHRAALIETGQLGQPHTAPCAQAPATDKVTVQRIGPVDTATTLVGVTTATGHGSVFVNLYPADARRIALAILDAADEAEGRARIEFAVPATPEGAARLLAEGLQ